MERAAEVQSMDARRTRRLLSIIAVAGCWAALIAPVGAQAQSVIQGTVTNQSNQPAVGVCVGAYLPGASFPGSFSGFGTTQPPFGTYSFNVSQGAGDYEVVFASTFGPCGAPGVAVVQEWWNDHALRDDADPVHVDGTNPGVANAQVTVTAAPANQAPSCPADVNASGYDEQTINVFTGCSDPNLNPISYVVESDGANGHAVGGPTLTYKAGPGYTGPDTFTAHASDGLAVSGSFTVHVDVQDSGNNQPPTCPDTNVFVETGSSVFLKGNCVDPENDPISYGPGSPFLVNGTATELTGTSLVFHPNTGVIGPAAAAVNYTVRDAYHDPIQFHVPIDVLPVGAECCESAPEATPEEPYAASVTSPVPGGVYIDTRPTSVPAPTGFTVLDQEYDMHAPDAIDRADPLVFVFKIDGAELAAQNVDPADVHLIRDSVPIHDTCPAAEDRPDDDSWWPCEESRDDPADHGGDLWITVLTMKASIWNVGVSEVTDADDDGVADDDDNCPDVANSGQADLDHDGAGAACDTQEVPVSKDDCKDAGWKAFNGSSTFKNQGDCVSNVATGGKNKPNGRRKHKPRHR